jgi:hypothetical protein
MRGVTATTGKLSLPSNRSATTLKPIRESSPGIHHQRALFYHLAGQAIFEAVEEIGDSWRRASGWIHDPATGRGFHQRTTTEAKKISQEVLSELWNA